MAGSGGRAGFLASWGPGTEWKLHVAHTEAVLKVTFQRQALQGSLLLPCSLTQV